jgi:hypothetical protein
MLFGLCLSNSYALKPLMNDLKIALTQIGSSNILKKFAYLHHCLVNLVLLVFGKNGMCTKLREN